MTVSVGISKIIYTGNGSTTQWDIPFPFLSADDLEIYVIANGEKTLITTGFTVNQSTHVLTYPLQNSGSDPLSSQEKLLILRSTALLQQTSFSAQEILDPDVLETGYDKAMMIAQDMATTLDRCVKIPLEDLNGETNMKTYLSQLNSSIESVGNAAASAQTKANNALSAANSALTQANTYTDQKITVLATQSALNSEQNLRQTADTTLQGNIDTEISARQQADQALETAKLDITAAAATYLTQTSAASTYLTQISAASTYATQSALASGLATKQNTLTTAQQNAVDSGVTSDTVAQVAAIDAELDENRPWQKPSDWIDIRSGAEPQSVTFLVGHSADYSTYPKFSVSVSVSNSGTYDVYVDGIKQALAVASGTDTTLTWQTLALTSGYDITYPSALRAHIVQVVPSSASNNVTCKIPSTTDNQGILWLHLGYNASVDQYNTFGNAKVPILEAITSSAPSIALQYNALHGCSALKTIPTVTTGSYQGIVFDGCSNLKHINLKDFRPVENGYGTFRNCSSLEVIETENSFVNLAAQLFYGDIKLKKLPPINTLAADVSSDNIFRDCVSLEDTVINFTSPSQKRLTMGGYSGAVISGLKGVTVSPSAPFDGTSPQIDVGYTGLDRAALVNLFNSMPTVSGSQVCNITGATGAADLTAGDLAIATDKGWTITR